MTNKSNYVRVSMAQVFKAVEYANDHPDRYLSGTTNWCAAVAFSLNRQIIADAQPADQQGEQMARMPVERCYDVRSKMIIAFNESKKAGGDLDDQLDAAYKSALRFSPNPDAKPATAKVDERKSFDDWTISQGRVLGYTGWSRDFAIWQARAKLNGGQA